MEQELSKHLEVIIANALAVTLNPTDAREVDEKALLVDLDGVLKTMVDGAGEMAPVLERLESDLHEALAQAPSELEHAATSYRISTRKWREHPPLPSREITAFVVLSRVAAAAQSCRYLFTKARYESLRKDGDPCDCAARLGAAFMWHRPEAPLKLLESSGVPYAAMDYVYVCEACGTKWFEAEGHDDMGSHSTWRATLKDR